MERPSSKFHSSFCELLSLHQLLSDLLIVITLGLQACLHVTQLG